MTPKQEKFLIEKYIRPMVKKMLKEEHSKIVRKVTGNSIYLKYLGNKKYQILINDWPIAYFTHDGMKNITVEPLRKDAAQYMITQILNNMGIGNQQLIDTQRGE